MVLSSVDFVVGLFCWSYYFPPLRRPLVPLSDLPGTTVGITQPLLRFRAGVLDYVQVAELQGLM